MVEPNTPPRPAEVPGYDPLIHFGPNLNPPQQVLEFPRFAGLDLNYPERRDRQNAPGNASVLDPLARLALPGFPDLPVLPVLPALNPAHGQLRQHIRRVDRQVAQPSNAEIRAEPAQQHIGNLPRLVNPALTYAQRLNNILGRQSQLQRRARQLGMITNDGRDLQQNQQMDPLAVQAARQPRAYRQAPWEAIPQGRDSQLHDSQPPRHIHRGPVHTPIMLLPGPDVGWNPNQNSPPPRNG
jgi:hypothetical protein